MLENLKSKFTSTVNALKGNGAQQQTQNGTAPAVLKPQSNFSSKVASKLKQGGAAVQSALLKQVMDDHTMELAKIGQTFCDLVRKGDTPGLKQYVTRIFTKVNRETREFLKQCVGIGDNVIFLGENIEVAKSKQYETVVGLIVNIENMTPTEEQVELHIVGSLNPEIKSTILIKAFEPDTVPRIFCTTEETAFVWMSNENVQALEIFGPAQLIEIYVKGETAKIDEDGK